MLHDAAVHGGLGLTLRFGQLQCRGAHLLRAETRAEHLLAAAEDLLAVAHLEPVALGQEVTLALFLGRQVDAAGAATFGAAGVAVAVVAVSVAEGSANATDTAPKPMNAKMPILDRIAS